MKNQRGFSLVEIMIAVSILSGLVLVGMQMMKTQTKSVAKAAYDSELLLITNEIIGILSDGTKCLATFAANANPTSIFGKFLTTGGPYGNASVEINSYALTGVAPDAALTITFKNKSILKGVAGPPTIIKRINLVIAGAPGAITSCRAVSSGASDIWLRGTGANINDIYFMNNVGIKTLSPTVELEVAGNILAGGYFYSSDRRLKKNIHALRNSLLLIRQLHGVSYDWKDKQIDITKKPKLGFIAQEVEKIFPEAVFTNPNTGMKSVDYANLIAPLVESIKEQQKIIERLESGIKKLREEQVQVKLEVEQSRIELLKSIESNERPKK